jgi:hypothetical protein
MVYSPYEDNFVDKGKCCEFIILLPEFKTTGQVKIL